MGRARAAAALGLDPARDFDVVRGRDAAAVTGRHAAWYFADELVAVARSGRAVSGFTPQMRPFHDLRVWNDAHAAAAPRELPPLVWLASPDTCNDVRIAADARSMRAGESDLPLRLAPKLALNRSWFDATSAAFFAARPALVRGIASPSGFEARVLWPEDFVLGPEPPPTRTLQPRNGASGSRDLVRDPASAAAPFESATLWQRREGGSWNGKAVLAFLLNGAQGDDDEAHAGHFAVATGRIADDGAIGDWLVNSLYPLDTQSEKGILAAPTPLANYQADVNAGQSWYRPTWMLVAVLDDDRAARRVQCGLNRLYRQFWRHQLVYYHPRDNCTSMSIDALRALGLHIAHVGPTSRIGAWATFPLIVARERSLAKARITFDYLVAERTRLLPAVALEAVLEALMRIARAHPSPGVLARELNDDLRAIAWLRIPQFPSSRAWGAAPVDSLREYHARLPTDRSKAVVVPVPPRPFPDALRDSDLLPPLPRPSDLAVRAWTVAPLAALATALAVSG